jgi:hypothetical protein
VKTVVRGSNLTMGVPMRKSIYLKDPRYKTGIKIADMTNGVISVSRNTAVIKQLEKMFEGAPTDMIETKLVFVEKGNDESIQNNRIQLYGKNNQ